MKTLSDTAALPARLRGKIEIPADPDRCWRWTASLRDGYGQVRVGGSVRQAHRVIYEILVEPVPAHLDLDHLCRRRDCVNPGHLEPVTRRVNLLRGEGFAAVNAAKTTCPHGHELSPLPGGRPGRFCRTCRRAISARNNLKRRSSCGGQVTVAAS